MEPHPAQTPLDKLSNRALAAIEAGRFQHAEQLCKKLLRVYRKAPDGHERMGMLRMAQGRHEDALRHYDKLMELARKEPEHFGPEAEQYIDELRGQAQAATTNEAGNVADPSVTVSHDDAPQPRRAGSITEGIARLFRGK